VSHYYSSYFQNIDEKGRVVLPGILRKVAEEECDAKGKKLTFKVMYNRGALALFTYPSWKPLEKHYMSFSNLDPEELEEKRKFFMRVKEVCCDRQGRMNIPSHLRDKAGLEKEIVIIGAGDHIEILSEEKYRAMDQEE
jgi:MraZ protein